MTNALTPEFAHVARGCVHVGAHTSLGPVEQVSLTAYLIAGDWVPFHVLHGRPEFVAPLATFGGQS